MTDEKCQSIVDLIQVVALSLIAIPFILVSLGALRDDDDRDPDAYVLVTPNVASAMWSYQQLKMDKCAWCGRTVDMNRHHVIPQAANPALRDVRDNLVILCRDCHFVLGHRCNWKQYNPDVVYICTHYTNCVKSSDTRMATGYPHRENSPRHIDASPILHVTNDVPYRQRDALERILKWSPECTNANPFQKTQER